MCYLYFEATILKVPVEDWSNGTAVYYWFNSNVFGLNRTIKPVFDLITNIHTVSLMIWGFIVLEFFLCVYIFNNGDFLSIRTSEMDYYFSIKDGSAFSEKIQDYFAEHKVQ